MVRFWRHFGGLLGVQIDHFWHRFLIDFCASFQERPESGQEGPKSAQERPKSAPRAAKSVPRAAKSGQKVTKRSSRAAKSGHKVGQERLLLSGSSSNNRCHKSAASAFRPLQYCNKGTRIAVRGGDGTVCNKDLRQRYAINVCNYT